MEQIFVPLWYWLPQAENIVVADRKRMDGKVAE